MKSVDLVVMEMLTDMMIMDDMTITMVAHTIATDTMKLDTIARIFFFSVKSNICQIIPDREKRSVYEVRQEKLIEHEDDPEWDDHILMTHDIAVV
jgi:hypothetical protein